MENILPASVNIVNSKTVPEAVDVLLGALPLEAMDPVNERRAGVHGSQPLHVLY
jgi:hypothetical protein